MEQLPLSAGQKKFTFTPTQLAIAVLVIAGVAFWGGTTAKGFVPFADHAPVYDARAPEGVDLAPLFQAWHLLDTNFAPATTTASTTAQEKLYGAIQGLAHSYGDDYTVFFPPVQKQIFQTQVQGDFEGVGMEIGVKNGLLTVITPIKDTPAARAGVESGDIIVKIDGTASAEMAVDVAVSKIRGKKGTPVVLSVSRTKKDNGTPFDISITRDKIILPTVDTKLRDDGVFVINLYSFNAQSPQLMNVALNEFANSGSKNLVLDLRGNPGGYLEAAVDIASWLLPDGNVVVIQDYGSKRAEEVYKSNGLGPLTNGINIAVLINNGSASAAEILAGALRDNGKAKLVGTQSFGKGSVQQVFDVTSDTSLKITIARWLTPNRISISHQGLTPDIKVEITDEDIKAERDPQLDAAVKYLLLGK